jgi:WD40 repeat protein
MSPEQAAGDSSRVDVRSDVYSLGVLAYEMLAGRAPHRLEGKDLAGALRALLEEEPPPLGAVDPRWRGDVSAIVGKAMAPEPERRYASAAAFAEDLRRYLRDEPVTARHPSALRQARRFFRRHKAFAAGVLTLVVALVGWLAFALRAARKEGDLRADSDRRAEDARRATYRFQIAAAAAALREADAPGAARVLAATEPRFRDWAWLYLAAETDQSATFLPVPGCRILALSADGTRFAFASAEGRVTVLDPVTGATLFAPFDAPATTAVEIVGENVATGHSDGSVRIWEGGKKRDLPAVGGKVEYLDATPDGRVLAATWTAPGPQPRTRIFDTRSGAATAEFASGYLTPRAPSLSRDGSRVAVPRFDADVNVLSMPGATYLPAFKGHTNDVRKAAWHPDGRRLATAGLDRTIRIWEEGKEVQRLTGHAGFVGALAFGGDVLASGASDATIRLWDAEGTCTAVLPGHASDVEALAFQGERLVSYGADGVRTWLPAQREKLRTFRGHTSYAYGVAFSADGTRLVSVAWDRTLRVWDVATGDEVAREKLPAAPWSMAVVGDRALAAGKWQGVQGIDLKTGERIAAKRSEPMTFAVAASPDGRLVAMGELICDARTLEPLRALKPGDRHASAFSADSNRVATVFENGTCRVWDVATGAPEWEVPGRGYMAVAFHPSGTLALGDMNGDVHLFDVGARRETAAFPAHRGRVLVLTHSPDGLWLVTGGDDNTVRFWDAATHDRILDLLGHDDYVHGLAFSRDGAWLASASGDSTVRIWSTVPWSVRLRSGGAPGAGR